MSNIRRIRNHNYFIIANVGKPRGFKDNSITKMCLKGTCLAGILVTKK